MTQPTTDAATLLIDLITEMMQDWDTEYEGEITGATLIAADLDFDSLDVVHLITAIEQSYGRDDFLFEDLLMVDGQYVKDLTIGQIADFVTASINTQ